MKNIEHLYSQLEKLMDTLGIPTEIPKGSFYDITDEEKEMNKNKTVNALTRLLSVQRRYVWQ